MTIGLPGEPESFAGDSGGPAFIFHPDGTRRLAGIVSRSASAAGGGMIHTRVDALADWIAATLHAMARDVKPSKNGGEGCAGTGPGCRGQIACRQLPA
jgi:secreted trypsin-like serine protease